MTFLQIPALRRFFKYGLVAGTTFLFDLGLLFSLIDVFHIQYAVAAATSFTIAVFCNYLISRRLVFTETKRSLLSGGLYFFLIAGVALVVITSSMVFFVEVLHWNYLLSRVVTASFVGTTGYVLNLVLNFQLRDSIKLQTNPYGTPSQ